MTRKSTELHNRLARELEIGLDDVDFETLDAVEIAGHDGEGLEPSSAVALYRVEGGVALYLSFAIEKSGSDPEILLRERIDNYWRLADETERLLRRYRELKVDAALSGVPDYHPCPANIAH